MSNTEEVKVAKTVEKETLDNEVDKVSKKAVSASKRPVQRASKATNKAKGNEKETIESIEKVSGEVVDMPIDFTLDEKAFYEKSCDTIRKEINKVEGFYLSIAKEVYCIYRKGFYKIGNYPNIYDLANKEFSLSRATCNNYINICEKFGIIDQATGRCTDLRPEYKDFSASQLVAMLPMENNPQLTEEMRKEMRKGFNSKMSVREIRRKYNTLLDRIETGRQAIEQKKEPSPRKSQKMELLKVSNIDEVLATVSQKFAEFERIHPDMEYDIAVTVEYKE